MELLVNILFSLFLLVVTIWAFKKNFKLYFIFGLIIYQAFTVIPSLVYIETGNKIISEQGRYGYFVGSVFYFGLFYLLSLLFIYLTFNTLKKVRLRTFYFTYNGKNIEMYVLLVLVIIVLSILLINAYLSPSPLFDSHVNRFTYWKMARFPILNKLFGNTAMFIPFALGILFLRYKKLSVLLLAIYYVYNFYIGQKFSPIVNGTFSFLLPLVIHYDTKTFFKFIFNKKTMFLGFILAIVVYNVIYNKYEKTHPFAVIKIYNPNEAMFYRIFGLQAHLFWGATERYVYQEVPHTWNISSLAYGMHEMMKEFAVGGEKFANISARIGFNFTNAYPSILLMVFPPLLAYFIHIFIIIFILTLSGWILIRLVENKSYILSLFAFQFFLWTIYALTMGYFYKLIFGIIFNALILIMAVYFEKKKLYE